MQGHGQTRVVPVHNLKDFFRTSIDDVVAKQRVSLDPQATHYVVNLLTLYARSEDLYEDDGEVYGLRPLALMLADAAETACPNERKYALQRIGDIALFISGFFIDSLARKAVDVDYYIHMGENAYGSLSDEVRGTVRGSAFADIYRELAHKFQVLVDVLNEVRDGGRDSPIDVLRTYEVWLKTGSRRAEAQLRQNGIVPIANAAGPATALMLKELQQRLSDTYGLDAEHDVRDFVISDPSVAQVIGQDALLAGSEETLFIAEDDDGLAMSLFLDADMLDRLSDADPLNELQPDCLDDFWKVLEGISHFSCVAFKAARDRKLSLLELELQGEVDKFVSSMRIAQEQSEPGLQERLHGWLFDDVRFHADLDTDSLDRYRAANDYAARFCHHLMPRLRENGEQAVAELRQFYRLPISDKISYIHAQAW